MKKKINKIMKFVMLICMVFSSLQTPLVVLADSVDTQAETTPQHGDMRLGEDGEIVTTGSVSVTATNGKTGEGKVSVTKNVSKVNDSGKYEVSFKITGEDYTTTTTTTMPSYTVFVLDASSSMKGTRWTNAKAAAVNFSDKLIEDSSSNSVALVTFAGSLVESMDDFSKEKFTNSDLGDLGSGTNYQAGFDKAYQLLNGLSEDVKNNSSLNIIFISDGEPNRGNCTSQTSCATSLAALKALGNGVNVYTFAYELRNNSTAQNLLKSISTNNKVENVTADNIDEVLAGFVKTVSGSNPAGTTEEFTDNLGDSFKIVKTGETHEFGGSYQDNTKKVITEDGIEISFEIQLDENATTGWHDTNAGFELVYTDSKTNEEVKITCNDNPQVYWESYNYQVNYYKDSISDGNKIATETRKVDKNTVINEDNVNKNKYLSDAGLGYEFKQVSPISITVNNPYEVPVINVLYTLKEYSYDVEYYYDNVLTSKVDNEGPVTHGTEVNPSKYYLMDEDIREGYKLDTINTDNEIVVIDSNDKIIRIYYVKADFDYTVNYHFGEKETVDNTDTNNTGSAEFGSVINPEDKYLSQDKLTNKGYEGYFINPNKPYLPSDGLTIGADPLENIIDIYYITTEVENEITSKTADKSIISSSSDLVQYTVNYKANVKNVQVGETLIVTIIDTLPKKIDVSTEQLAGLLNGGIYDESNNTITWTFELEVDEYTENYVIDETVKYTVKYKDFANMSSSLNNILLNTVKGMVTIDSDSSNGAQDEEEVTVAIDGTLIVNHVDEEGKDLVPSVTTIEKVGTSYSEPKKEIYGYTINSEPDNRSGNYIEGIIEVTFVYSKNPGKVTENEVEKTGLENVDSVDGKFDYALTYNAEIIEYVGDVTLTLTDELPYEIDLEKSTYDNRCTYENKTLTCTQVVSIDEENQEVNEEFKLSIVFKDLNVEKVINKVTSNLVYGDKSVEDNSEVETEVLKGTVVASYVDEDGNELAEEEMTTGLGGTEYETSEKTIYGYTLVEIPENESGKYVANETIEVVYVYGKNKGTVVENEVVKTQENTIVGVNSKFKYVLSYSGIVNDYVGEATVTLTDKLPFEVLDIKYPTGCTFNNDTRELVCQKTISLSEDNQEVKASFEIEVTYKKLVGTTNLSVLNKASSNLVFEKNNVEDSSEVTDTIKAGNVVATYKDTLGSVLATEVTMSGLVDTEYETNEKTIYGYTLVETPENAKGSYIDGTITVEYIYSKNPGKVTENEVEKTGLENVDSVDGKFDYTLTYNAEIIEYVGDVTLALTDELPYEIDLEKSTYDNRCSYENKTLTCTQVVSIDEENKEVNEEFKLSIVFKDLNVEKVINKVTSNLVYGDKSVEDNSEVETEVLKGIVVASYVDEEGNELAEEEMTTGLAGTNYKTSEKEILGYTLVETPENESGKYVANETIEVVYVYGKNIGTSEEELVKIGSEIVTGIDKPFEYTITYNTEIFDYVGEVEIEIKDIPQYEIDEEKSVISDNCQFNNGEIVCNYKLNIVTKEDAVINIAENLVLYYKDITSSIVNNRATATLTYGGSIKSTDSEWNVEVLTGSVIAGYVDEDGKKLTDDVVTSDLVGKDYQTKELAFDGYFLKEVQGEVVGKYTEETISVIYVYSRIPLPPQTGVINYFNIYVNILMGVICLFVIKKRIF